MLIDIGSKYAQLNTWFSLYLVIACGLHMLLQLIMPWFWCMYRRGRQFLWWLSALYILLIPAFGFMLTILGDIGTGKIAFDALDFIIIAAISSSFGGVMLVLVAALRLIFRHKNHGLARAHAAVFWLGAYVPALIFCAAFMFLLRQYF